MEILTAAQMNAIDRDSNERGVPVRVLMENAGEAVAWFCRERYPGLSVVVLCGKGNNGGDGAVAARLLAELRTRVRLVLLGSMQEARDDAASAFTRAKATEGLEFVEVQDEAALREALADADLIVDAVVGTGFKPPLRGLAAAARDLIAGIKRPVVAVDLPSGWDADSTAQTSVDENGVAQAFRADAVVTFVAPKMAHVFGHLTPGSTFGPVVVAQIGTPVESMPASTELHWAGTAKRVAERPRDVNGNKGRFGHVLIVGGSLGKAGAPSMASVAAMRTGAGLTTAAVPRSVLSMVAAVAPELMSHASRREGWFVAGTAWRGVAGGVAEGDDGRRHWAGAGAGRNDAGVCARVCGARVVADGDRCGCAECACRQDRAVEALGKRRRTQRAERERLC